jgi:EAL domain-containing protein (putative c-di-GMP-specific phosphodiesterase class I)
LQLRDETLPDYVQACLQANGLAPAELGLELTESQHVPDDPLSIATLKNLEALGIYLEMDDFGMGYSSMLYIRRFNFDAIKLDGSLTREVMLDNNCSDIIASVVLLGRAVGIRVVAEYVETREQQAMLEELGCEVFQGYLYSAPLAGAPCLEYLLRHQCEGAVRDERSALPQPA